MVSGESRLTLKLAPAVFWVTTNACPPVLVVAVTNTFESAVTAVVSTTISVWPARTLAVPIDVESQICFNCCKGLFVLLSPCMSRVISTEKISNRLSDLVDEVSTRVEHVVLTKNGKEKAVLLSKEEFDSWRETLEVANDEDLVNSIKKSLKEVREGETIPLEQVIKDLQISV